MRQELWIPGPLPGMNQIIEAAKSGGSFRGNAYRNMKRKWGEQIGNLAHAQGFIRVEQGIFSFIFREPNKKRDPDNFIAGGRKLILDALKDAGLLAGDGWKNILGLQAYWDVDAENPGVRVVVNTERY